MQRVGRRNAFITSALLALALAALVVAWAIVQASCVLLCCAALVCLGSNLAFQQQQRFAAAECVPPGRVSLAVSVVMTGTLVAAAVGPQLALGLKQLVPGHEYAGSFVGVAVLCIATAMVLTQYRPPPQHAAHVASGTARTLGEIVRQPSYLIAVLAGVVSYAVMSFIMTATPISMHVHDRHSDAATAWVIQIRLLAMYTPSLFSGALISRIGVGKIEIYSRSLESNGYDPLPVYREPLESVVSKPELAHRYPLTLTTGGRHPAYLHSQHRNIPAP